MKIVMRLSQYFLFALVALGFLLWTIPQKAYAQDNAVTIAAFVREGCVHCADEEKFLTRLQQERNNITVRYYRLENTEDRLVWDTFTTRLGLSKITPITVIGNVYLVGFDRETTTGREIRALVDRALLSSISTDIKNPALIPSGQNASTCPDDGSGPCIVEGKQSYYMNLPFFGRFDAQKYPLVALAAILGFFDGFNPCAMWVLVTFLVILLQVGNRKKMFVFAGTFIAAEAIMYGLILTVWYKTWDFVRLDSIVTPIVGIVSIIGGVLFLREWRKKELECKVTDMGHRARVHQKIRKLATDKFTVVTLLGILGIAFSVNIIEFACSIGIPQAFTKILELNALPRLQTAFFLLVYIFFYMLDDFLVFGLALLGAEKLSLTTRYSKLSNLLGGIVMIVLGSILLLKSRLLLF